MSKESLGIILNGNPNYMQKKGLVLKTIDKVFRFIWIPLCVIGVILLLAAIGKNSASMLRIGGCVVLWGAIFALIACIWGTYGRCPFCGHFFTLKRISNDKLVYQHDRSVTRKEDEYHSGVGFNSYGNTTYYVGKSTRKVEGTETTKEFTFNSRCTCCYAVVKIKRYSFESK